MHIFLLYTFCAYFNILIQYIVSCILFIINTSMYSMVWHGIAETVWYSHSQYYGKSPLGTACS